MQPRWDILHAMLHCSYKAWQLGMNEQVQSDSQVQYPCIYPNAEASINLRTSKITPNDKLVLAALFYGQIDAAKNPLQNINIAHRINNEEDSNLQLSYSHFTICKKSPGTP